jgi:glycosyltransferase involved in cell wall biosynthesis
MKYPQEQYPKISVITVVYNGAKFIERAINSLLSQKYPNIEFLVLDAVSTDGTLDIIEKYKGHIDYFRSRKDNGPHEAINEGITNSTGSVIALLNSDDYFNEGALLKVGEAFIENPEMEMVSVLGKIISQNSKDDDSMISNIPMDISNGNVPSLMTNCRFYHKSLFDKYGKFIEDINGKSARYSDYELITRFSLFNIKNMTIPFCGYTYVAHEGSVTFNTNKYTKLGILDENAHYIEGLLKNYSHLMDKKLINSFNKKLAKSYKGRVVKNITDKQYGEALKNIKFGTSKFGITFPFGVARYFISYHFRFKNIIKKYFRSKA